MKNFTKIFLALTASIFILTGCDPSSSGGGGSTPPIDKGMFWEKKNLHALLSELNGRPKEVNATFNESVVTNYFHEDGRIDKSIQNAFGKERPQSGLWLRRSEKINLEGRV